MESGFGQQQAYNDHSYSYSHNGQPMAVNYQSSPSHYGMYTDYAGTTNIVQPHQGYYWQYQHQHAPMQQYPQGCCEVPLAPSHQETQGRGRSCKGRAKNKQLNSQVDHSKLNKQVFPAKKHGIIYNLKRREAESSIVQTKQGTECLSQSKEKYTCGKQNSEQSSDEEGQAEGLPSLGAESDSLQQLQSLGFNKQDTNIALLCYFKNDLQKVIKCLQECSSNQALKDTLSKFQSNFIILEKLGFCKEMFHWKVLKMLEKNQNNLMATIQKLTTRVEFIRSERDIEKQLKDCKFNMLQTIPVGCEFIIDGFNVVRTNKHLKRLTVDPDLKCKLQAIVRLKIMVQTLASGYLVLDKKFLDDKAWQETVKKIDVQLEDKKNLQVVYADLDSKADDKIVQILKGMAPECRSKILLLTSDRDLIIRCQQICGPNLAVMGGKVFVKQCKKLLPKGVKTKIIKGKKVKQCS